MEATTSAQQTPPTGPPVAASASEPQQQQQQQVRDAQQPSSSEAPRQRGPDKQQEYLEAKYGSKDAHVNLSKEQVEGMLDRVLSESSTVKYLLESLKLVSSHAMYTSSCTDGPVVHASKQPTCVAFDIHPPPGQLSTRAPSRDIPECTQQLQS